MQWADLVRRERRRHTNDFHPGGARRLGAGHVFVHVDAVALEACASEKTGIGQLSGERIQKELTEAMKARDELRLSVLRGIKSAIKLKEVEKIKTLDEAETIQILQTLMKQRGIEKPGDQRPGFFWIPVPVSSPGIFCPDGTCNNP